MKAYEGMFLFDPAAAAEWSNVEAEINRLIERAGGKLVACRRWDERRLAYEIRGRKRGCYVLTYFRAPGDRIGSLERDAQLSEQILRCLILRVDHMTTDEEMRTAAEKLPEPPSDSDRGDRWGRPRFRREGEGFHAPAERAREVEVAEAVPQEQQAEGAEPALDEAPMPEKEGD